MIYITVEESPVFPLALAPSSAMFSRKRLLMSGKKSSLGNTSVQSLSVKESVMKPVVALVSVLKNLIALLSYKTRSSGVSEAYCPSSRCTPQDGMGKI